MQQRFLKKFFFLVLLLNSSLLYGQDYLFKTEQISVEDGLSNRFVRSILQDTKGFMWFATQYGLNRYDGYQFKVLTKEDNGLQSNFIDKIYLDADSNIWVGHSLNNRFSGRFSGIDLVNINTFEVQKIEAAKANLPFNINELYEISASDTNDWLYLLTTRGEVYIYKGQGEFELFYEHDKNNVIHDLKIGKLYDWLYCENELIALDKKRQIVNRVFVEAAIVKEISSLITCTDAYTIWLTSYVDGEKDEPSIWSWNVNGALKKHSQFDFLSDTIVIYPYSDYLKESLFNCTIYSDRFNLRIYNPSQKCIYKEQFDVRTALKDLYIDRQSNLWIAKSSEGILKISYQENKFTPHFTSKTVRAITTIQEDSALFVNRIITTEVKNLSTGKIQEVKSLGRSLYKTLDGKYIWVGTVESELKKINSQNLKIEKTYTYKAKDKEKKQGMKIGWAVHKDKKDCIWLGTSKGLAYLDEGMDSLGIYKAEDPYKALENSIITTLYENEQGLWIGTSQGLYLMNSAKKIERHYCKKNEKPFQLPHEYILGIHEDKQGAFWLSTRGGGIIQLNLEGGEYEQFTTKEGLSHNIVYAILEDEQSNFWMSSDYGLMRFNPKNHIVNTYLPSDGILHEEFNHPSAYKTSNGRFYFGGISGVVAFNPSDFYNKTLSDIPLEVVNYQCFNSETDALENRTQDLIERQEIVLDYTDRFFVLSFALLDFKSGYKKHYAYQIEGLDKEWNFIESNSIRINGLAAGDYVLKIKGQGNNGIWSSSYLEIPILVKKPFYLTFAFIGSVLFIFVLLLIAYFRWREIRLRQSKAFLEKEVLKRTEKIEQQADELRALDDLKSRFFANVSHELRTPLTLITGPVNAILERHYGTDWQKVDQVLEVVKRNGNQLEKLIKEILLLSKLEANNIAPNLKGVLLFSFIETLFKAFEVEAELKGINYELDYQLDQGLFLLLDENKLEKIINNLLSNAFKYTSSGKIELVVQEVSSTQERVVFDLILVDSGQGISEKDLPYIFDRYYQSKAKAASIEGGVGIGLALAFEFAQVLGGSLSVESTLGQGSRFKLQLEATIVQVENSIETIVETEPTKTKAKAGVETKKARILVVEDNADMRLFIADLLSPNYHIDLAENGLEAIKLLEQKLAIDLIVSDVMMPEMDGFELLTQIKADALWRKLPVIMLTARTAEKDKLSALRIGVDDYLTKPFSHEELLIRIQNLLQNYQERKNISAQTEEIFTEAAAPNEQEPPIKGAWLKELEAIVLKEIGNSQFTITRLAADLYISERQLRRKIKAQTGLTPHRYFTLIKLEVAREYLEVQKYATVAEIAYKVGFSNVSHFSKIYEEQYGKRPIAYLR